MTQRTGARIMVVDDEPAIVRAVRTILPRYGFQVEAAENGRLALDLHVARHPDLILLDLGLPDIDGLEVIRRIRGYANTPIVVLSVRGGEREKVEAINLGADDYLTKPFGVEELVARIRLALRHAAHPPSGNEAIFRTGDLAVDFERRLVTVRGHEVRLTPTEYDLLKAFVSHSNKVLTNRILLQQVWGPNYGSEDHYLHVYVGRLRRKIEADPQKPRHLVAEPGVGYRFLTAEG